MQGVWQYFSFNSLIGEVEKWGIRELGSYRLIIFLIAKNIIIISFIPEIRLNPLDKSSV